MSARRPWALPLVPLYWVGLRVKDGLRSAGLLPIRRLARPVLSVGSLSAGGAGKTPAVIALARLLQANGHAVDVLSRGYGGQSSAVVRVDPAAPEAAAWFGDEPVLIGDSAGVPVWVGSDRYAAGVAAEQACSPWLHLLDDGFQHRALARTVDLVLVTAEDLADSLLPAGNRREPLSALGRADIVVLREEESAAVVPVIRPYLQPGTQTFLLRRTLQFPDAAGGSVLAFCGIARPQGFLQMLPSCGLRVIDSVSYPDHHRYTVRELDGLVRRLQSSAAHAFVTTEKDAVKITPELRAILEAAAPMHVARLHVEFTDPAALMAELEARCR